MTQTTGTAQENKIQNAGSIMPFRSGQFRVNVTLGEEYLQYLDDPGFRLFELTKDERAATFLFQHLHIAIDRENDGNIIGSFLPQRNWGNLMAGNLNP